MDSTVAATVLGRAVLKKSQQKSEQIKSPRQTFPGEEKNTQAEDDKTRVMVRAFICFKKRHLFF
jgi:hypothetical protein